MLREREDGQSEVTPLELFFDLVYVLAVTQLAHYLLDHLTLRGAAETLLLMLIVWATWIHVAWTTNYFDLGTRPVRLALLALMLASLFMSAAIPDAFGRRGLLFATAAVAILAGWSALLMISVGRTHHLRPVFGRVLVWEVVTGALLLGGGLASGTVRVALWLVAVVLAYVVMWLGFPVPGRGKNRTTDYTISGDYMAERYRLFVILALGESILVSGAGFGDLSGSPATTAAFGIAFVGSAALWWIYFDRAEEAGRRVIANARNPGRFGLSAYTYAHIPIVAGIVVAATADEVIIAHPLDPPTTAVTALILGGPILYLGGIALFKQALWGHVPRSRPLAIGALLILLPMALVVPILGLAGAATLIMVALALWDVSTQSGATGAAPAVTP